MPIDTPASVATFDTVRAGFSEACLVDGDAKPLARVPASAPVVLVLAEKHAG